MAAPDVEKLVPDRRLSFDGQVLAPEVQARISRIVVELNEDIFNQCTITFTDPELALINGKELSAGVGVFVELGYQGDLKAVFEGEIVSVEPRFVRDKPPSVVVRALERLHRLALAPNTRAFNDVDSAQIVKKIAQEHGLSGDAPAGSKGHLLQPNISDFQVLKKIASRTGTRITLDGKKLTLGPPPSLGEMELLPGQGVKRLKVKLRTTEQVQKVFVRGWDPKNKKEIVGQATAPGELADGGKEAKTFDRGDFYIEGALVADTKEAETIAKATVSRIAERFANAEGELLGDADLLPGRLMNFDKFGELLDGKYRATATRHEFDKRGYRVQFNATRVAKKKAAVPFKSDAKPLEEKSFISFTLTDADGKPMSGIQVTVDVDGEGKKSGVTNGAGGIRFGNIKKDAGYSITFKAPAEETAEAEDEETAPPSKEEEAPSKEVDEESPEAESSEGDEGSANAEGESSEDEGEGDKEKKSKKAKKEEAKKEEEQPKNPALSIVDAQGAVPSGALAPGRVLALTAKVENAEGTVTWTTTATNLTLNPSGTTCSVTAGAVGKGEIVATLKPKKGAKLEAKLALSVEAFPAELVWPPAGKVHKQFVNLEMDKTKPELGDTVVVKVKLKGGKAGDVVFVKQTYANENLSAKTALGINGSKVQPWAPDGGLQVKMAGDDGTPDCEALLAVRLPQVGGDKVTLNIGGSEECTGPSVVLEAQRKLYYQLTVMKKDFSFSLDTVKAELAKHGVDVEETSTVEGEHKENLTDSELPGFATKYFKATKTPFEGHIILIDRQCEPKASALEIEATTATGGETLAGSVWPFDDWIKSSQYFDEATKAWVDGGFTLEKDGTTKIKYDLSKLAVQPTAEKPVKLKLDLKLLKGEYTGDASTKPHVFIAVGKPRSLESKTKTVVHEIGHAIGMVPTSGHDKQYSNANGGLGSHCRTGATPDEKSKAQGGTFSGVFQNGTCVMYSTSSEHYQYCDTCKPHVRKAKMAKADMSGRGW